MSDGSATLTFAVQHHKHDIFPLIKISGDVMSALIQLTLDGSFIHEKHKVSLRVLSHAMSSIQSATDRAYLDVKFGNVWKHQRLPKMYYEDADFIVGDPREGSFLIEFTSSTGREIVKRLRDAILDPYRTAVKGGAIEVHTIGQQVIGKKEQLARGIIEAQSYDTFKDAPAKLATRTYGDKSINKEIDQMLSAVRRNPDSMLKLVLKPDDYVAAETFEFDQRIAKNFKEVISSRQLGDPVVYTGTLRSLDHGHKKNWNLLGKFINAENDKDVVLHIQSKEDFDQLVPYLDQTPFSMVACPIIEFSSFDPVAGDLQFIEIL